MFTFSEISLCVYLTSCILFLAGFALQSRSLNLAGTVLLFSGLIAHAVSIGQDMDGNTIIRNRSSMISLMIFFSASFTLVLQWVFPVQYASFFFLLLPVLLKLSHVKGALTLAHGSATTGANVHSLLAVLALSTLSISFMASVLYLVQERQLKKHSHSFLVSRLPALTVLDRISYQSTLLGFLFLTLSIVSGTLEHRLISTSFFGLGSREILNFLSWLFYAFYFHIRYVQGALSHKLAIMATFAYLIQILSIFAMVGNHPY